VSKRAYFPERGDLVLLNFMPSAGREIDKRRPAIVLSPLLYNRSSGLCLAVPLSTKLTPGPMWLPTPPGLTAEPSLILCDYVRSVDYRERSIAFVKKVPPDLIDQITERVLELIDPLLK
jgi:mRNA interferase MazF